MNHRLFFLWLFLVPQMLQAQDFPYAEFDRNAIAMQNYPADTSASAVVIKEFGETRISNQDRTPLIFQYHVKIKIFKSKGFDQGNVVIPIYKQDNNFFETVEGIKGSTFYTDERGVLKKLDLDPKKVYRENKNKNWDLVKFAMPGLKEGCIIEYTYTLESPNRFNFRKWEFQSDIPKMHSEYIAHIPGIYVYNVSLKGALKLTKTDAVLEKECFTPGGGVKADCSKMTYIMTDIPAFKAEAMMTSPENFKSAINFELAGYTDFRNVKHKVTQDWKDIDATLREDPAFGGQLKKKDVFKNLLPQITANTTDELATANAVYTYLQKWFKWNQFYATSSEDGIRKAYESRSGNVADINLSLVAALNAANLKAEAVLLSTRENGMINKLYPVISNFNYVVAKVNIGDQSYLLDATDPLLPFGLLPLRCINDQGRVINLDKPSYWIDLTASQKAGKVYTINLALLDNGKLKGTINIFSTGYAGHQKRSSIKGFNSIDEYVEDLDEKMPKLRILKSKIRNLDTLESALGEMYEVEMEAFDNLNRERYLFNPFFMEKISENPFKLEERTYPVDLGAASETKIILSVALPEQFTVSAKPENIAFALPNQGGRFITKFEVTANQFVFSELMQLNKAIYDADEYPALKELFNKIVQVQLTDVEFRKL